MAGVIGLRGPDIDKRDALRGYKVEWRDADRPIIRPHTGAPVLCLKSGEPTVERHVFGFSRRFSSFNARDDKLEDGKMWKPMWRQAGHHGIAPVSYILEWSDVTGTKLPYRIERADGAAMAVPALVGGYWEQPGTRAFALVTIAPNRFVGHFHDRMIGQLADDQLDVWLHPEAHTPGDLRTCLSAPADADYVAVPVDPEVGSSKYDETKPLEPRGARITWDDVLRMQAEAAARPPPRTQRQARCDQGGRHRGSPTTAFVRGRDEKRSRPEGGGHRMAGLIGLQAADMEIQDALRAAKWDYEGQWVPHPVVRLTTTMPIAINKPDPSAGEGATSVRTVVRARWGFPVGQGRPVGNARDDKLLASPMWGLMLAKTPALAVTTGVYEQAIQDGKKVNLWFRRVDGKPIVMPALSAVRKSEGPDAGAGRLCCAIVTTTPNPFFAQFHDRQVCSLTPQEADAWMAATTKQDAMAVLHAADVAEWEAVPVDPEIFKPGIREDEHLRPIGPAWRWTGKPEFVRDAGEAMPGGSERKPRAREGKAAGAKATGPAAPGVPAKGQSSLGSF